MVQVASSAFKAVERLGDDMIVHFHKGRVYRYFSVPYGLYIDLVRSHSPGQFFNTHIRGRFEAEEV